VTYAYRDSGGQVALFASETGRKPPKGFRRCGYRRYMAAWRERDARLLPGLLARAQADAAKPRWK
jgi:hypothetical protein